MIKECIYGSRSAQTEERRSRIEEHRPRIEEDVFINEIKDRGIQIEDRGTRPRIEEAMFVNEIEDRGMQIEELERGSRRPRS